MKFSYSRWSSPREKRAALSPQSVRALKQQSCDVLVESSTIRIYSDQEYVEAGAQLITNTDQVNVVLGIKEPPLSSIQQGQVHLNFSHTIKGQPYNMPLLQTFLDKRATLIDYEPMVDNDGKRIASVFSWFAGVSGTIETLVVTAAKLGLSGKNSKLANLKQPYLYKRLQAAKEGLMDCRPLQEDLRILIVGKGNVGSGCRWVCEALGLPEITPEELKKKPQGPWFCVVDVENICRRKDGGAFLFKEYVEHGTTLYESTFAELLGSFNILLQGAYWDERYPKQLPLSLIAERAEDLPLVIGDISCDIDGTLESTIRATTITEPVYTFNAKTLTGEREITFNGPAVMSIDNLPCELPADTSDEFSNLLMKHVRCLVELDLSKSFKECSLSEELKRGTLVYKGELTPPFRYLKRFLGQAGA